MWSFNSRSLGWLFVLTMVQQSDKQIVVVFIPTDLSELDNSSQKRQITRLEGPHPFPSLQAGSPTAMSLLTNICSICSQSSPVMEIPHLPQTANFPASFPSATESFIHYLTWISSFATTGSHCFLSHLSPTKRKKMPYSLQQPLNSYHLTNPPSYSGYVLLISRLQLFGHYNLKNFPQNVMHFKSFHCKVLLCCICFTDLLRPLLLSSATQGGTNTPVSAVFADSKLQICLILIIAE